MMRALRNKFKKHKAGKEKHTESNKVLNIKSSSQSSEVKEPSTEPNQTRKSKPGKDNALNITVATVNDRSASRIATRKSVDSRKNRAHRPSTVSKVSKKSIRSATPSTRSKTSTISVGSRKSSKARKKDRQSREIKEETEENWQSVAEAESNVFRNTRKPLKVSISDEVTVQELSHEKLTIDATSMRKVFMCTARHEGHMLMQERLLFQVDVLYNMLFSTPSPFLAKFHEARGSTDLRFGKWVTSSAGERERVTSVTVRLQPSVGPKTCRVTEQQTLLKCSHTGYLYAIDVVSANAGIPYADAFRILLHYCLVRCSDHQTDVLVFAQIHFLKSVWGVVKSFIETNTVAGLKDFFQALHATLLEESTKRPSSPIAK